MNGHTMAGADVNGSAHWHKDDFLPSEQMPLHQLAVRIQARVAWFLAQKAATEQIRHVQIQTRISLSVIQEAFDRYEHVQCTF
jgi:hypothetical protein